MTFRERSAWVMSCMLILVGGFYLKLVIGDGVPPSAAAIPLVLFTVVLSIAAQIVLALMSPRETSTPADERERLVIDKAAHFSSYVLPTGVVAGLGWFMASQDGMALFHIALTSLVVGQIIEYGMQIFLLRSKV
ncbi:hypothetical protein [Novosphingobium sp. Chol11]|uniref:hypothetical protein n=1 Tax=Novosphingobium sp. Chol11 TaxID=1385763 RepID=UPI0025DD977C|nr:hypothetical protein [Novosphingobium sp. Chol11]